MTKKHARKFIHVEITPQLHNDLMAALDKSSKEQCRNISITEFVVEAAKKYIKAWEKAGAE